MKKRVVLVLMLIAYAAILYKVMVLKDMPMIRIGHLMLNFGGTHEGTPNFIPFRTIWMYLRGGGGWLIAGINLAGNVGLLIPVGFLLPFIFPNMGWMRALVWAIASGLVIEGLQMLLQVGIFDIDDVILNAVGVTAGYGAQKLFVRLFHTTTSRALALGAMTILGIAGVYGIAAVLQGEHEPVRPDHFERNAKADSVMLKNGEPNTANDPCRGTGGTGKIGKLEGNDLTILRRDGTNQVIHLTPETQIRSSTGQATVADLKVGDGVTIVTGSGNDDQMNAEMVLICGG